MIKNILKYYYNFTDFTYKIHDNSYIIYFNNEYFYFTELSINLEEINEIDILLKELSFNNNISQIIKSNDNNFYVIYDNKKYILIKVRKKSNINFMESKINYDKFKYIDRSDWIKLWSNKIDYLEYQKEHLKGKYEFLNQYFDFFVGVAENAIMVTRLAISNNNFNLEKTIQHKRYEKFFYDNPLNIIVDYKVRDISEYIKYKFFYENIKMTEIENIISKFSLNLYELELLFARLLFPTFYFDIYDKVVNENFKYDENFLILKFDDYLKFLQDINKLESFKKFSFKIEWLK